jgi:hypothetical protein
LLGIERSRLINRPLPRFVAPASQPVFQAFLEGVFAGTGKRVCEAALLKEGAAGFWANFHGISAISVSAPRKWCRVAVSDITFLKEAEEAQRRMEALAAANGKLQREIVRLLGNELLGRLLGRLRLLEITRLELGERNLGSLRCECLGRCPPDSTACSSNQNNLAVHA